VFEIEIGCRLFGGSRIVAWEGTKRFVSTHDERLDFLRGFPYTRTAFQSHSASTSGQKFTKMEMDGMGAVLHFPKFSRVLADVLAIE
jgi:hypothetical protein